MTTELVLLGTAGAPLPVAGRGGVSSALTESEWARRAGQGFSGIATAGRDGMRRKLRPPE